MEGSEPWRQKATKREECYSSDESWMSAMDGCTENNRFTAKHFELNFIIVMDGDWASWVSTLEKKTSQNFIRPQRSNQLLNYSPVELIILLFFCIRWGKNNGKLFEYLQKNRFKNLMKLEHKRVCNRVSLCWVWFAIANLFVLFLR